MSIASILGQAHWKAKAFVDTFQNPFGDYLKSLDTVFTDAEAGKLTFDQAKAKLDEFNQQWSAFDAAAEQWKGMGGDYAKVVGQAYDPNKTFMKTVADRRAGLERLVGALTPATDPNADPNAAAATPPDTTSILGGLNPQGQADAAAMRAKKKALSGPGYAGTILGGASAANTLGQRKTLLGY